MNKPRQKKLLIAAGGTGGHLFPAQALAQEIETQGSQVEVLFAASGLALNRWFDRDRFSFRDVRSATPFAGGIWRAASAGATLIRGVAEATGVVRRFAPDLVIGFGSFHAFPVLTAAVLLRVPIMLFESNAVPGKVNRLLTPFAQVFATQFSQGVGHGARRVVEVRMPLRWDRVDAVTDAQAARVYFGLEPDRCTLLVLGGSQGAMSINHMLGEVAAVAPEALRKMQILHLAGTSDETEAVRRRYARLAIPTCVKEFERHMDKAWTAASLALCRAGACTLAELLLYEVPSILIPYPSGADRHQYENAELYKQMGGAIVIPEDQMEPMALGRILAEFSVAESPQLSSMQRALRSYKETQPRQSLYELVMRELEVQ